MDSVFQLSNGDRVSYLHSLMQSFAASYICLWTYSPDLNFMYCEDGYFQEEASSSTEVSISGRLFNEYKLSVFPVGNDLVPGLAFRDKNPNLILQEGDLQRLASIESQRRFYQEANIKTAVFFGCERGEIELGMSNNQQNLEMKIQSLFPRPTDNQQKKPPSSSSSQSMDSPEYITSLFYDYAGSSGFHLQPEQPSAIIRETHPSTIDQQGKPSTHSIPITTTTTTNTSTSSSVGASHLHHHHPLLQNIPFPTAETTDAALTKAYLAILSSPSSSSTGGEKSSLPYKAGAFRSYHGSCSGPSSSTHKRLDLRRQALFKRAIAFYRGIHFRRIQELSVQGPPGRPTSNQLHHMISERKRREKINESFQALRSLLPSGTKKDKASVLKTTKEYLTSLKAQLSELNKRNQLMEAQLVAKSEAKTTTTTTSVDDVSTNERLTVRVTPVLESTSRERLVNLQVILRMETSVPDLVIRVLEFLKQVREAIMVSMEAQTHQDTIATNDQIPTNWVTFRLKIEGDEWDESAFIEAIRRLVADLAS